MLFRSVLAAIALLGYLSVRWGSSQAERKPAETATPAEREMSAPEPLAPTAETPAGMVPQPAPKPATAPDPDGAPESQATTNAAPPAADGLHFERTVVEVAVAADAAEAVTDFPFTNHGAKVTTIREVEKDCDCAEVQVSNGKLSYAPGESGIIRARFRLENLVGTVDKHFQLFLADDRPDQPSHLLVARIRIPVLIELSAKTVDWTVGGEPAPRKVELRITHDQPIHLRNPVSSRDDLRVALKAVEEGRHYELWLEPSTLNQPGLALVRVETDSPIPRWKLLQVFARFLPPGTTPPQPAAP